MNEFVDFLWVRMCSKNICSEKISAVERRMDDSNEAGCIFTVVVQ